MARRGLRVGAFGNGRRLLPVGRVRLVLLVHRVVLHDAQYSTVLFDDGKQAQFRQESWSAVNECLR